MQRRQKARVFSTEINVQPPDSFGQNGRFFFLIFNARKRRKIFLTLEPETCQAGFICRQQDGAQWGSVMGQKKHMPRLLFKKIEGKGKKYAFVISALLSICQA